jgi:hypothetical protein
MRGQVAIEVSFGAESLARAAADDEPAPAPSLTFTARRRQTTLRGVANA